MQEYKHLHQIQIFYFKKVGPIRLTYILQMEYLHPRVRYSVHLGVILKYESPI